MSYRHGIASLDHGTLYETVDNADGAIGAIASATTPTARLDVSMTRNVCDSLSLKEIRSLCERYTTMYTLSGGRGVDSGLG